MRKSILFLLLSFFVNQTNAQIRTKSFIEDNANVPREHPLDFTKLKLDISFEPTKSLVKGKVTHYFTALRPKVESFFLDAIQMKVSSILINGQEVKFKNDSIGLTIIPNSPLTWNEQDSMVITYEANPKRGLYFIGWNDPNNLSQKQIWSQGEGIDNRYWIPMYDERNDKIISELNVNFDENYKVLSNGHLVSKENNSNGTITWHYAMQNRHAPYLIMLGIGKYDIKETKSASGTPMHLYYYPAWKDRVEPTYEFSEKMFDFFEKEIGVKYPWESYSQIPVQDYMFGAMENTTATVFGDFYMVDKKGLIDRNYVAVNAHELAHQWFGDDITALDDAHQWLQESFATYYNQMFEREVFGSDYFNWSRRGAQISSIDESTRNKFGIGHSEGGGVRVYGKGAFVLNMLKYVVGGSEMYNKAIKYYLEKHAYQNVDGHDLLRAFEETTGMQLDWFWDEWVYRGGEPSYAVSLMNGDETHTNIIVQQTQQLNDFMGYKNGLFKMPIWINVYYTDGSSNKKQYWIQDQTQIISIQNEIGKKIDYILFDEGNEVLKTAVFNKSLSMLSAQALKADQYLDRYDAVVALKSISLNDKRNLLQEVYRKEQFYPIRAEVVAQLANDNNQSSVKLLNTAIKDNDAFVRKAVLRSVEKPTAEMLPAFEKLLTDSSYEVIEAALVKLSNLYPTKIAKYLSVTKDVEGNLGKHVLIRWLETAYHSTGSVEYANQLVALTSESNEFRTRGNAFAAIKRIAYYNETLCANAVNAMLSPNGRLAGPANEALRFFYSQDKYRSQIHSYITSLNLQTWERAILQGFGY